MNCRRTSEMTTWAAWPTALIASALKTKTSVAPIRLPTNTGTRVRSTDIGARVIFRAVFHMGAEAVAALLMVGTMSGILRATLLNNGGGAWDNAKKYIESGLFKVDGVVVGKKSEPHKAAVVGDTVGDPFKDTAGPSLHVLIKLLSTITLVLAPLFII